jgi:hypothetical protein
MRLATAFVEIAARTDDFRRQLDEARQLATSTADTIRDAFEAPPGGTASPTPDNIGSHQEPATGRVDHKIGAQCTPSSSQLASDAIASPTDSFERTSDSLTDLLESLFPDTSPIGAPEPSLAPESPGDALGQTQGFSTNETVELLRQQLDLGRNELDVLNKQLDVLQDVKQGVPATFS